MGYWGGPWVTGSIRWLCTLLSAAVLSTLYCADKLTVYCGVLAPVVHLTTWAWSQSPLNLLIWSCAVLATCTIARCGSLIWGSLCQVSPRNSEEMWTTRYLTDQQAPTWQLTVRFKPLRPLQEISLTLRWPFLKLVRPRSQKQYQLVSTVFDHCC